MEPDARYIAQAQVAIEPSKLGTVYHCGMQSWTPPSDVKYDLIWSQWVLNYLTDGEQFFSY